MCECECVSVCVCVCVFVLKSPKIFNAQAILSKEPRERTVMWYPLNLWPVLIKSECSKGSVCVYVCVLLPFSGHRSYFNTQDVAYMYVYM